MNKPTNKFQSGKVESFGVTRARVVEGKNGSVIFFSLDLNGVTINNCRVAEGKNGDFISLPQYRGNDNKYYSHVFFRFSEDDEMEILKEVEKQINRDIR